MVENPMVLGLDTLDEAEARRSELAARAYRMLVDEFHAGLRKPLEPISTPGFESDSLPLVEIVAGLLVDEEPQKTLADAIHVLITVSFDEAQDLLNLLAHRYAEQQVLRLTERGAFDE